MGKKKKQKTHWIISFKRPQDDSWLHHIPMKRFKSKTKLLKYLLHNVDTVGTEFKIIGRA